MISVHSHGHQVSHTLALVLQPVPESLFAMHMVPTAF